jgi:hypothetical protein
VGDSLQLDTSFVNSPEFVQRDRLMPWKTHSSLITLLARLRQEVLVRTHPDSAEAGLTPTTTHGWYYAWNFDSDPPADSIPAFRHTARILTRFAREAEGDGRKFVLFVAGTSEQEDRDTLAHNRADTTFHAFFDTDKPQRYLKALGAREGFDVVILSPDFRAVSAAEGRALWHGSPGKYYGHWTSAGHAVAAGVMRRYFETHLAGWAPEMP